MGANERFANFIVRFEQEAYETNWNWDALSSELRRTLPLRVHDILRICPRPTDYDALKELILQVDQRHWEEVAEQRFWNQRPTAPDRGFAPRRPAEGTPKRRQPPPANANDAQHLRASNPENSQSEDLKDDTEEAILRAAASHPLSAIPREDRERRRQQNLCLLCGDSGHYYAKCPRRPPAALGRAVFS